MLKVSDLRMTKLPKGFLQTLPETCPNCGNPTLITETLSMLSCSNKSCGAKTVQRAVMMLAEMGIKNLGEAKVHDFLDTYKQNSPYAIIAFVKAYPQLKKLGNKISEDFTRGIIAQFKGEQNISLYEANLTGKLPTGLYTYLTTTEEDYAHKTLWELLELKAIPEKYTEEITSKFKDKLNMALWEFIRLGNMPKIKDSARKLFQNYDNLSKFYTDIEEKGVTYVQELLGIQTQVESTTGLTEMRFIKHLADNKIVNSEIQHMILSTFLNNFGSLTNTLEVMDKGLYNHDDIHIKGQWLTSKDMQTMLHGILKEFVSKNTKVSDVTSIKALDVFNTLIENKEELLFYIKYFTIEKIKPLYLNICISTSVGAPYTSKLDFEYDMKSKYGDKIQLNFLKSVTKDCNVLICGNKEMQTSKLQKAIKLQNSGYAIAIMTGEEFDKYMSTSYFDSDYTVGDLTI